MDEASCLLQCRVRVHLSISHIRENRGGLQVVLMEVLDDMHVSG